VNVPANGTLVVAVQEANANSGGCSGYSVTVSGLVGNTDAGAQCPTDNLTAKLTDPLSCTGPGNVVNGSFTLTNNGATTTGGTATVTLPVGLKALPGLCTASVGTCAVVNESTIAYSGTLTAAQSATVSYQLQIADGVALGTQLCSVVLASLGGGSSLTASACLTVNCLAAGPGLLANAASPVSDQLPGSVLVYNIFSSSATNPNIQNTRLSITNTNQQLNTPVHLFFVDGASCSVADSYICLTPNQTTSFQAFDFDPGTTGYVIAIAVDANGCPRNFNFLIGDEYVKLSGGFAANLAAESFSALAGGLSFCNINSVTTTLNFDGISYTAAPRVLALDNLGSRADGNNTLLIVNRFGGNLATGASTLGTLFGIFYDDTESSLSFSVTGGCQLQGALSNTIPRITPRLENFIPAGRSGWLKLYSQNDIAILGAAINANPNAGTTAGAFNQGHNLHKLRLSTAASLSIPIFPPGC
jgi:hypothetical protein